MFKNSKDLKLLDLIDIKFLQEFQDNFSQTANVASLTYDIEKPVTQQSNFTELCAKYIRASRLGCKRCSECDIKWGKIAAEKGEPVIYTCHAGLTDFVVPIMLDGKHIGSIFGGQILTEQPDEKKFRKTARELGIDEDDYIKALRKIKIISPEEIKSAAKLLYLVANSISNMSNVHLQLIKVNDGEKFYRKIIEILRSSLDINEVKKNVIYEIGKAFKADRCYFRYYDRENGRILPCEEEYLSSPDIKSLIGIDSSQESLKYFMDKVRAEKRGFYPIVVDENLAKGTPLESYMKENSIKTNCAIPIIDRQNKSSWLILHYIKEPTKLDEDTKKLLETIAYQIDIAFGQINLYNTVKNNAEREKINRNIIEILRSTLDRNSIKNLFVRTIGEYFKADRVLFLEYDLKNNIFNPIDKDSEYLLSPEEKSFVGFDCTTIYGQDYSKSLLARKELNIVFLEEYSKNGKNQYFISLLQSANIKSSYNIPVIYQNKIMGYFSIGFTKEVHKLSEEDIELIRNICNQAGIGLHQAELYIKAQEASHIKSEFIAKMSHEIKTPLNIIIGFSDVLAETDFDKTKQIEYLNNIKQSGKHILDLTNDIILMSKVESENFKLNYEVIDLEKLIHEAAESVKLMFANKNINIEIYTQNNINIKVDKKTLMQILYNLLNNAIKFTQEGGNVLVKSEFEGNSLIISVEDDGIGISAVDQEVIFEKFTQLESAYSRREMGAGLGLSITKRLVDLHNGSIHVESIKNKGSKFWFVLPEVLCCKICK